MSGVQSALRTVFKDQLRRSGMYASRNISLCTKDCLCLFVCPTGATDTETGQIDRDRCLDGCRLCVDACPSHAIYLVKTSYPEPKPKQEKAASALMKLLDSKAAGEAAAAELSAAAELPGEKLLAAALQKSLRILSEDCAREAGFMLPQSAPVRALLRRTAEEGDEEAKRICSELLERLQKQ
jgi:Fe-S-cluster-containing hydrogenase component 2